MLMTHGLRPKDPYVDDLNSSIGGGELAESGRGSSNGDSLNFRLMNLHRFVERERVAAGWPAWLSDVTSEAIQGWVPLKADSFQKLDKAKVHIAASLEQRELETGMIVALKLDGLITSHSSSSIYLVFENMEHDITGLLSCPDVSFSESQVSLYSFSPL
ncbi:hypothetical protein LINPERHAP1_LOCUS26230 [Linum perenne]